MKDLSDLYVEWQRYPLRFVQDIILSETNPRIVPTKQQEEALMWLGKLVVAKIHLYENKATEEEKKLAKKIGISIQSGHGVGKDTINAWAIIWFLSCFPNCKIPCTAPTADQLDSQLWAEITKWIRNSKKDIDGVPILSKWLTVQNRKVFFNEAGGREWFAIARTVNKNASVDEQGETLAGFHEDFMMIIANEASGLPEAVFKPLEGGLTGKVNLIIMTFNPTRSKGFAIESQQKNRQDWICLHWDAEKSEIVTKESVERMARKYGRDSNPFRIRVKGLPPLSESDVLIPWEWIDEAVNREIVPADDDPLVFAVDAGAGGDHSCIIRRRGPKIEEIKRINTKDTMVLTGHVSGELLDWESYRACCVDNIGIGLGVYNRLRELKHQRIFAVDVRASARNSDRFVRLRDELWWNVREHFEEKAISIPDDPELISQLSIIKWGIESNGKIKIESKEEMHKRGIESPNDADALMMSMYVSDRNYRQPVDHDKYEEAWERMKNKKTRGEYAWMSA